MTRFRFIALALWLTVPAWAGAAPQRIVSTSPSVTEMLYALGLGSRVVGVTTFCHYPSEVREKPKIGSYLTPNVEAVLALKPDLVVTLAEQSEAAERLQRVRLPVLALSHNDLEGIFASIEAIGREAGVEAKAREVIGGIRERLEDVRRRAARLPRRTVLFIVGRSPGTIQDLMAVGQGPFLNELIEIAGGTNLFDKTASLYPRVPREEIYSRRPEVIIDMGDMSNTDEATETHRKSVAALWRERFPGLPAVREGRVYAVAEDIFVVPGPRITEAAEALLRMIHPEAPR